MLHQIKKLHNKPNYRYIYKGSSDYTYVLHLQSPRNSHLNVTMAQFHYTGMEDPDCTYGGVSFYYLDSTGTKEFRTVCATRYVDQLNLQNVYSENNQVIMVTHPYQGYSQLNISFTISHTECHVIAINACALEKVCDSLKYSNFCNIILQNISALQVETFPDNITVTLQNQKCIVFQIGNNPLYEPLLPIGIQWYLYVYCISTLKIQSFMKPVVYKCFINGFFSTFDGQFSYNQAFEVYGIPYKHDPAYDLSSVEWVNGTRSKKESLKSSPIHVIQENIGVLGK